jgi:hypothetical protein
MGIETPKNSEPAPKVFKRGEQYDFPVMPRPSFGDVVTLEDGKTYQTHRLDEGLVSSVKEDTIILVQAGYWVMPMTKDDFVDYIQNNELDPMCMVFIPQ